MLHTETVRTLDDPTVVALDELLQRAFVADGHRAIDEHRWIDARRGDGRTTSIILRDDDHIVGYAQVTSTSPPFEVDLVVDPAHRHPDHRRTSRLLHEALTAVSEMGGGRVHHWGHDPTDLHEEVALAAGLHPGRALLQMTIDLPLDGTTDLETRPFRPGVDDDAWLAVNNAAFAWHPEQADMTHGELAARMSEPWFDPAGFLLHEIDGRLAGFCWTKVHADADPPMGEIYVIAVHPEFHGRGLGRSLVVAGLASLAERGLRHGMLYVDEDNDAAVGLYRALGFADGPVNRSFTGVIPAASPGGGAS